MPSASRMDRYSRLKRGSTRVLGIAAPRGPIVLVSEASLRAHAVARGVLLDLVEEAGGLLDY